jgi:hypothetical protein
MDLYTMGVDTNLTIIYGVTVLTIESQIATPGLQHTVIVIVLTLIYLPMIYKWTEIRRKMVTAHSNVAPTVEPAVEWTKPIRRKRKKVQHKKKAPGHIPAYDEWPEYEIEHRLMVAEQARQRLCAKQKAKKRNRNNKWFKKGMSQWNWNL